MTDSTTEDELFEGWSSFARYPAMLGGTMGGQLVGIAFDAMIGSRSVWIPLFFSVVLEAFVGARYTPRGGVPLDARRCVRISWTYSLVLACISVPLFGWVLASNAGAVSGGIGYSILTPLFVVAVIIGFAVSTVGRAALMMAIVTRRR